jgi:hypothetical protein
MIDTGAVSRKMAGIGKSWANSIQDPSGTNVDPKPQRHAQHAAAASSAHMAERASIER